MLARARHPTRATHTSKCSHAHAILKLRLRATLDFRSFSPPLPCLEAEVIAKHMRVHDGHEFIGSSLQPHSTDTEISARRQSTRGVRWRRRVAHLHNDKDDQEEKEATAGKRQAEGA